MAAVVCEDVSPCFGGAVFMMQTLFDKLHPVSSALGGL